jgi:hypothetical protein
MRASSFFALNLKSAIGNHNGSAADMAEHGIHTLRQITLILRIMNEL